MVDDLAAWEGFFTYVGLVGGGLTGLVFVALSLQITEVRARPAYIARARTTLAGLTGFLVVCGLALVPGQSSAAFAIEAMVVFSLLIVDIVRTVRAFTDPRRVREWALIVRTTAALTLLGIGVLGCIGLLAGISSAMALIGVSTLLGLPVRLIQAWAILVAALPAEDPALTGSEGAS